MRGQRPDWLDFGMMAVASVFLVSAVMRGSVGDAVLGAGVLLAVRVSVREEP